MGTVLYSITNGEQSPPRFTAELLESVKTGAILLIGKSNRYLNGLSRKYGVRLIEFRERDDFATLNSVPSAETGLASAMIATQRNLGRNVGVALAALAPTIYWAAIGAGSPSIASPAYPQLFLGAFRAAFLVVPVFALVGIALLSPPKPPLSQVAEAATGAGHESAIGADRNGSPR